MKEPSYSDNLKDEWKRIDQALIPADLLISMPQPECKGLTLLTDAVSYTHLTLPTILLV